ncbi:pyridoxal phosphate-dependent transferase [Gorgonomyces haynaldii]|nr:pyridoxal phosphate-dependent transferase [Gorgonomyces haynaldii]
MNSFSEGSLVNDAAREIAYQLVVAVNTTYTVAQEIYKVTPGSRIVYKYIKASYQNDPFRVLLDVFLIGFMIWYLVSRRYKRGDTEVVLTEKEVQDLIDEWEPESLVPELTPFQRMELDKTSVLAGQADLKCKGQDGKDRLNFASYNFLGIMNSPVIKEKAISALRTYGVGSCGPPGFYGTIDVHVELERKLADFIGSEDAIIYSQGFSCISSAIPAFSKRGDIIVADEAVSFAVQKGMQISRSQIKWFKHNDIEDLQNVLEEIKQDRIKKKLPLVRQFIVVEGIYSNYGDICPLPELLELKNKYKYRLIVEESNSIGVLGERGAGVCDHFNIPASDVDIIIASLSNAFASAGGFCCGSKPIVEHQRLSGLAYTFSASLPAMLAVAAIEAINIVEQQPSLVSKLSKNSQIMYDGLKKLCQSNLNLEVYGDQGAPFFHLQLSNTLGTREADEKLLQDIVDIAANQGVILTRAKYVLGQELRPPSPSIRVAVSAGFSKREVEKGLQVIKDAAKKVLSKYPSRF